MPVMPLLLPLFWPVAAIYLGGMAELKGGSAVRELIGLFTSFIVFVAVWWGLGKALAGIGPVLGHVIIPTALSLAVVPFILTIVFRLVGIRVERGHAH